MSHSKVGVRSAHPNLLALCVSWVSLATSLPSSAVTKRPCRRRYRGADRRVFKNIKEVLMLAGCTLEDVGTVGVWLNDARDFGSFNRVYMECFGGYRPVRKPQAETEAIASKFP
jgi:hypothetical protein